MTPEQISRINELARKSRDNMLTEAEKIEQSQLRRAYIDTIKSQIKHVFDGAKENAHDHDCNCGCNHNH
ncbi:MAG: hypothetical protein H6Q74_572 [Firmicutes bacterium]|nr:hypothetical protein [Bacillota bacterium]